MTSHELAAVLLLHPDLPVATHAHGHTYLSAAEYLSHGALKVGLLESYAGQHIVLGDIFKRKLNYPNEWVSEMLVGTAPEDYER